MKPINPINTLIVIGAIALFALTLAACTLTQPGGLDTPEGQEEMAEIADLCEFACNEAARAVDEDAIKIDSALGIVHKGLIGGATLAQVQADFKSIGLKGAWISRGSFVFNMTSRRLRRYVKMPEVVTAIADTVVASCRAGIASANVTLAVEHTPIFVGAVDGSGWQS